ncbi:hypothetical protein DES53_112109 [Roseimicrobium gellanilyticum]|uniref:Uncharacterized protein n=1 Tax=Roseimicrobium gellanilyticum TaxID=748857 RepID=A0A366H7G3_9BACT|nr:hypothetical protein DES53_112109 [Roseimicrobium gellanilyticum]
MPLRIDCLEMDVPAGRIALTGKRSHFYCSHYVELQDFRGGSLCSLAKAVTNGALRRGAEYVPEKGSP